MRLAPAPPGSHATQSLIAQGVVRGTPCIFKIARPQDAASAAAVERDIAFPRELAPHPALLPLACSGTGRMRLDGFSWIFAGRPELRFKPFVPGRDRAPISAAIHALSSSCFDERTAGLALLMERLRRGARTS